MNYYVIPSQGCFFLVSLIVEFPNGIQIDVDVLPCLSLGLEQVPRTQREISSWLCLVTYCETQSGLKYMNNNHDKMHQPVTI